MPYSVVEATFKDLTAYAGEKGHGLHWPSVFVLPGWLEAWWNSFGAGAELFLRAVMQDGGRVIGVAPLARRGRTVSFIGGPDVCDYLDFVIAPGREEIFFELLLDHLAGAGVTGLNLHSLREDSPTPGGLARAARRRGLALQCTRESVSLELVLPSSWEQYLAGLSKKQRHEVRRKLRRLQEAGRPRYVALAGREAVQTYLPLFFRLFTESRGDKAIFMNEARREFFRSVVDFTVGRGLGEFGLLELDGRPAAMVLYFDYCGGFYLYNSGYDPRYASASAGLLCKIFCLRDAVERGRSKFDFLKGAEDYKYRLGAREVGICAVNLELPAR